MQTSFFNFPKKVLKREGRVTVQRAEVSDISSQMDEAMNVVHQHVPPIQLSCLSNKQTEKLMCILTVTHTETGANKAINGNKQ